MNAQIIAIDHAVPETCQTSEELAPLIGKDVEWIRENAGVERRFVSSSNEDPAKMIAKIATPMLEKFGVPDLVIHAGTVPRQLMPDSSVFNLRELGLSGIAGFTVNAACLSFLMAMRIATNLIRVGEHQRILICTTELATHARDFKQPESAALIGDGAAAMLLSASDEKVGVRHFRMQTWPEAAELAEFRGGGFKCQPNSAQTTESDNLFQMQGKQLLKFSAPKVARFVREFLCDCQLELDDIDVVVPHQASGAGMKLLQRLGFSPEKTINIIKDYGNCAAASIPMALSIALQQGRIRKGDRVLILGTASGISIGAALIQW